MPDFISEEQSPSVRQSANLSMAAQGMIGWASADSLWVHKIEPIKFSQALDGIRQIDPKMIFSAHLPPARGKTEQFLELLATVPTSTPFLAPNQTALEQMLAQMMKL